MIVDCVANIDMVDDAAAVKVYRALFGSLDRDSARGNGRRRAGFALLISGERERTRARRGSRCRFRLQRSCDRQPAAGRRAGGPPTGLVDFYQSAQSVADAEPLPARLVRQGDCRWVAVACLRDASIRTRNAGDATKGVIGGGCLSVTVRRR